MCLIELLGLLTGLRLLDRQHLIYPRLSIEFGMLVYFTNLGLMELQVRYLTLCLLFSVIGDFGWFWIGTLNKDIQLMLEFHKGAFLLLHFSYYTLMTFLMMLIILPFTLNVISIWSVATTRICFWTYIWSTRHCGQRQGVACWFQCWNNSTSFVWPENGLDWIGTFTLSLMLKLPPRKLSWSLWKSMKFLSPEVALYLYNSTIQPCMEYFCNVWASARICYLELLDKLQIWICRTTGPWLAASLEPLAHRQNVANLSLFNRY